jgi:fatty acid desaturase
MRKPLHAPVEWRDLLPMTRLEIWRELLLPLPAALLIVLAACWEVKAGVVIGTFAFFMLSLRVTHGVYHRSVGLRGTFNDLYMCLISALLGGSMHAIAVTHLYHHQHPLEAGDVEGEIAHHGFWAALWRSPLYPFRIHWAALQKGNARDRRWIIAELILVALVQVLIWFTINSDALKLFSITMWIANALVPMIGIWSVHVGCVLPEQWVARTCRWRWMDRAFAHMFFHLEHHLYPAVPASRLHLLAERLDKTAAVPVPTVHPQLA